MGQNIQSLIGQLDQADTLDDLQSIILTLRDQFRIDHAVYHWISSDGEQFGCGTYPTDWVQTYVDNDYLRVDPVVIGCYQRFHPVVLGFRRPYLPIAFQIRPHYQNRVR